MNAINRIRPFWSNGTWVFTDPEKGLTNEPFVAGADRLITAAVKLKGLKNPEEGFNMTFSKDEFPGYDLKLEWVRPEASGNIYRIDKFGMEGWLCPALLKYFDEPPKEIYVKIGE